MRSAAQTPPPLAPAAESIFDRPERATGILADRDELTVSWSGSNPG